ncbi:MAG: hypothetical protein H0V92_01220 [Pseudonocardiales bacterium]|nr:hypothetical protein [Pseudonocardiales bacterium]
MPAHVSLLYPFVGAAELDERVTDALSELVTEHVLPLRRVRGLASDPMEGLTELTRGPA